ncbi:MAG: hypothetical protein AAFO73_11565 [Pseudomonadota bacterium]
MLLSQADFDMPLQVDFASAGVAIMPVVASASVKRQAKKAAFTDLKPIIVIFPQSAFCTAG